MTHTGFDVYPIEPLERAVGLIKPGEWTLDAPFDNHALQMSRPLKEHPVSERRPMVVHIGEISGLTTVEIQAADGQGFQIEDQLNAPAPQPNRGSSLYVWPDLEGDTLPSSLTYTLQPNQHWTVQPPGFANLANAEQLNRFGEIIGLALFRQHEAERQAAPKRKYRS